MANHKSVVVHEYGPASVLKIESEALPVASDDQVVVKVAAAGINPIDWKLRSGAYKQYMPVQFPWHPGIDFSGIVQSLGKNVKEFKVGDAVFGMASGAYAEYVAVNASDIIAKPASLSFEEAATIPVGALTAWKALLDAGVKSGDKVLVLGAAGGVGLFGVQFAKAWGATVYGSASAKNLDYVKKIGADFAVDYAAGYTGLPVFDAVFDTVGMPASTIAYSLVKKGGVLVTIAGMIDEAKATAAGIVGKQSGRGDVAFLKDIVALIKAGKLQAEVQKVFPFAEVAAAHVQSETGHGRGRIVIKV